VQFLFCSQQDQVWISYPTGMDTLPSIKLLLSPHEDKSVMRGTAEEIWAPSWLRLGSFTHPRTEEHTFSRVNQAGWKPKQDCNMSALFSNTPATKPCTRKLEDWLDQCSVVQQSAFYSKRVSSMICPTKKCKSNLTFWLTEGISVTMGTTEEAFYWEHTLSRAGRKDAKMETGEHF
jgi:hypothetical protein